jgi:protein phosphatase
VDTVVEFIADAKEEEPEFMLEKAITQANAKVRMSAANNPELEGMGTTVVVATCKDGKLCVGNVGDSRLYIMSEGALVQLTIDHSWVEEMVRRGAMTREEAKNHPDKNIITRAVGTEDDIKIDFFRAELKKGDLVLMCTDGLTNMVQDEEILERLTKVREGKATLEEMVSEFIDFANLRGGMDNISVVLIAEE